MLPKLKRYDKKFEFSYTYGTYPTLDLLKLKPEFVHEVILNPEGEDNEVIHEIQKICVDKNIDAFFNKKLIDKLAIKENTYAIGVFAKYSSSISSDANHIVLVNPSNMGNLGTIIRTMVGFGIHNLAVISPAADIFDPKVLRSTMGAFFSINFEYFDSIEDYIKKFPKNNLYGFILDAEYEINDLEYNQPFSLIFGNEGAGLSDSYRNFSTTVYIKHSNTIDSLNLSVCAGIAMHKCFSADNAKIKA